MADRQQNDTTSATTTTTPTTESRSQAGGQPAPTMLSSSGLSAGVIQRKLVQRQQRAGEAALDARYTTIHDRHNRILESLRVEDATDGPRRAGSSTADGSTNVTEVLPARPREDRSATGSVRDLRVGSNQRVMDAKAEADRRNLAAVTPPAGTTREQALNEYDTAVTNLNAAYIESPLYSSDDTSMRGDTPWQATSTSMRLRLAQPSDLQTFQSNNGGYVKYVIPFNMPPATGANDPNPDVIVGSGAHVEIAQGPVRTAGLLYLAWSAGTGSRPTIAEAENTSGGFRPGPLRNQMAHDLIVAAGYQVNISDNQTGAYERSPHAARQRAGGGTQQQQQPPQTPQTQQPQGGGGSWI